MQNQCRAALFTVTMLGTWLGAVAAEEVGFEPIVLERGGRQTVTLPLSESPNARDAVLVFRARLDTPQAAGHTHALRVSVNGTRLAANRLLDKPLRIATRSGAVVTVVDRQRMLLFYAPDFTSVDAHPSYAFEGGHKTCEFALRVTDLVKSGQNAVLFEHVAAPDVKQKLVVADAKITFREPTRAATSDAASEAKPPATFEPRAKTQTDYETRSLPEAKIEVTVGGESFTVESRFSTPKPEWVRGGNSYFRHERQVERKPEAIVVRDTFTNLTDEDLPIMQRHQAVLGDRLRHAWLGGLEQPDKSGEAGDPSNPTSLGVSERNGIGLMPLDDVFRIHVTKFVRDGGVGIADKHFVLKPKGRHTAEWAIVPIDQPDYWRFLNAARRLIDANFTIPGGFCFLRVTEPVASWSEERLAQLLRNKDPLYACADLGSYGKEPLQGTAFQKVARDHYPKAMAQRRRVAPSVKNLVYFHCYIDVRDEAPRLFADSRTLMPDGVQGDYANPAWRLFFPTESNSYGPAIAKNVDIIFDEIGADGVYWDEHEYSRWLYHYGEPWDGVSADIDPDNMTIVQRKSSVTLITEPWRLAMAKRILSRGPLTGNGVPFTRAMAALRFPCFVETGMISYCAQAHLYSPVALGDWMTEENEIDAYHNMLAALDYGCVYNWYDELRVMPTHRHLTSYMFPITPVELGQGFLIGKERIITRRSGLFGWGDASEREVHVFDQEGREVKDFAASVVQRDGKTYTELGLPEFWSAAMVRKP